MEQTLIYLEAGHGGNDPGAVNGDVHEADINLLAALTIKHTLVEAGYSVLLSRDTDILVPHPERIRQARQCSLAISIHHDTARATRAGVYYQAERIRSDSERLARSIASQFDDAWVRPSTDSRFRRLYIDSWRPTAVLLELGPTRSYTRDERIAQAQRVLAGLQKYSPRT